MFEEKASPNIYSFTDCLTFHRRIASIHIRCLLHILHVTFFFRILNMQPVLPISWSVFITSVFQPFIKRASASHASTIGATDLYPHSAACRSPPRCRLPLHPTLPPSVLPTPRSEFRRDYVTP